MPEETTQEVFICPNGHQVERFGACPLDGKLVEAAHFICKYCGYATRQSKTGMCPNCEAEMLRFTPESRRKSA